jgi:hypothetical protein
MAAPAGCGERMVHERRADAAIAAIRSDRHWSEQQRRLTGAAHDTPETGGANDALPVGRDKSEPFGWRSAVPQALRTLAPAVIAEGFVEERLARCDIGGTFFPDRYHLSLLPPRRATKRALRGALLVG